MTPQDAISKLRASGWTMAEIASHIGMFRTNLYKIRAGGMPTYRNAVALVEMAKRGKKPPRRKS
jgi:hypothetical protein